MILAVEHLGVRFGGLEALRDVNIQVPEGECLGVIGPNGAGKTTLFNLLTGFTRPTTGRIYLDGSDITRLAASQRAKLGMVRTFQLVSPFKRLTVAQQLAVAIWVKQPRLSEHTVRSQAMKILGRVGLEVAADQAAETLSHGELKRLEIARVVAATPRIALFDEPAGGLSQGEIAEVVAIIQDLNRQGLTVLLVEHVLQVVRDVCHRVVVLNEGVKIAEGAPEAVARNPEVIAAYLGREAVAFAGRQ